MAKFKVYLETSVISYATAWPSRDLLVAARQMMTRGWFANHASEYDLFVSELVVDEVSSGDPMAAQERLALIESVPVLTVTEPAIALATALVAQGAVPAVAVDDAYHIAVAAVHGVHFLLTWNCRHIANALIRSSIERICRAAGVDPPVICTTEELNPDG